MQRTYTRDKEINSTYPLCKPSQRKSQHCTQEIIEANESAYTLHRTKQRRLKVLLTYRLVSIPVTLSVDTTPLQVACYGLERTRKQESE